MGKRKNKNSNIGEDPTVNNDEQLTPVTYDAPPVYNVSSLSEDIKTLLLTHPFYGYVLSNFKRNVTEKVPTAAISIDTMTMYVNPRLMDEFNGKCGPDAKECRLTIFKHEILHPALHHFARFKIVYDLKDPFLNDMSNIAMDCAINQIIASGFELIVKNDVRYPYKEKGFQGVSLDYVKKICQDDSLLPNETAEYYYSKLINSDNVKKMHQECKAFQQLLDDLRKGHKPGMKDVPKHLRNKVRKLFQKAKAMQKRHEKMAVTEPGKGLSDILPNYDGPLHKDLWKQLVDRTFGEEPTADNDVRYGRPNRRNDDSFWYTRHKVEQSHVYLGWDTSGSISDKDLNMFAGYVKQAMKKYNTSITLIQCDVEIADVSKFTGPRQIKPGKVQAKGRGGTDLIPILDFIEKKEAKNLKKTRLILFTDGYTPFRESQIRTSVVYTKRHEEISSKYVWNSAVLNEVVNTDEDEEAGNV